MARPKSNGPYTPLAANYFLDDSILEAKEHAELLSSAACRSLRLAIRTGSSRSADAFTRSGVNLRSVEKRIDTLLDVGLLLRVDGGFIQVRSYLKWNKSAEQIGRTLRRDRERKARKQAEVAPNSDRNPDGIHSDSAPHVTTRHVTSLHDTETFCLTLTRPTARTLLDESWRPNQRHIDLADSLHLDKQRTFERFVDPRTQEPSPAKELEHGVSRTGCRRKRSSLSNARVDRQCKCLVALAVTTNCSRS